MLCVINVLLWEGQVIVPSFCFHLWQVGAILLTLMSSLRRQSPFFVSGSKLSLQRNGIQPYFFLCQSPQEVSSM